MPIIAAILWGLLDSGDLSEKTGIVKSAPLHCTPNEGKPDMMRGSLAWRSATMQNREDVSKRSKDGQLVIRPIQYLRAIAALMVVWHHSLIQVPGVAQFIALPEFGPSGVDIFFVISGFIMLVITAGKEVTPAEFIRQRVIRVVPLYWLTTLLMLGCAVVVPTAFKTLQFSPAAVAKSLLFVPYDSLSFPGHAWPVLVPGWTLNYEMFFYGLFAAS